jgi:hypothetical protein
MTTTTGPGQSPRDLHKWLAATRHFEMARNFVSAGVFFFLDNGVYQARVFWLVRWRNSVVIPE